MNSKNSAVDRPSHNSKLVHNSGISTWEGKRTHDYHKLMSLNNILQALVAACHSGPALHPTITHARNVILGI